LASKGGASRSARRPDRPYGLGTIYPTPDGRWAANLELGYVGGRRKRKLIRGTTPEIVEAKLNAALADKLFGHQVLSKLTAAEIQAYIAHTKLAPATIRLHISVLHCALTTAVHPWRLLKSNPADGLTLPKKPKRKYRVLDVEAALKFLEQIRGDRWEALYVLAFTTGARIGELLALQWDDVDLEHQRIHIRRKVLHLNKVLVRGEPKTEAGERTFELLPITVEALERHRDRQAMEREYQPQWEEPALVFSTHRGTVQRANNITSYYLPRALQRAGATPMTMHEFRHSFGTVLLKNREDPAVVAQLMGHSSARVTMEIYRHVLEGETEATLGRFWQLLEAAREANGHQNGHQAEDGAETLAPGRQEGAQ
jgi:integrase